MNDNQTTEIEIGSGNIFADLGLDDADELYTRTALGIQVMKSIREKGLNQKEAGEAPWAETAGSLSHHAGKVQPLQSGTADRIPQPV